METTNNVTVWDYDQEYRRTEGRRRGGYSKSNYVWLWAKMIRILRAQDKPSRTRDLEWDARCSLLEIGCGTGQLAQMLFGIFAPNIQYTGIDMSSLAIRWAKESNPGHEDCFVLGDVAEADWLLSQDWAAVVSMEALEHLVDDVAVLGKLRAKTKVIFSVPDFDCPSHARYFTTKADLKDHYGGVLDLYSVQKLQAFWLCVGVRR